MKAKLDTARVFERIFEIYKDQFTLLIPAALVIFVPVALVTGVVYGGDAGILGALLVTAAATIATFWFQGMVVEAAEDILDGRRDHTIGSLFRSVLPVLLNLVLAGLLVALATVVGFVLLIVPGLLALTFFAVVAPAVVLERAGATEALGRSIELVRGNAWRVFGVIVVLFLIELIANSVIRAAADSAADSFVVYAGAALVVSLLVAPLRALAAAVLYFELKALQGEPVLDTGAGPIAPQPVAPPPPPRPEAP